MDAAVATATTNDRVYARIAEGAQVTATKNTLDVSGFDEEEYLSSIPDGEGMTEQQKQEELEKARAQAQDLVSVYLFAEQEGHSLATASAFNVGGKSAVGACAGVNDLSSLALAEVAGTVKAAGKVRMVSHSENYDDAYGTASAVGADIQRYLDKANLGEEYAENIANGKYPIKDNTKMQSSSTRAIQRAGGLTEPGVPAAANQQNTNIPGGSTGAPSTTTAGNGVQIAAAVGINLTEHKAHSLVTGTIEGYSVSVQADNNANFRAKGNAATVTLKKSKFAVAAGVAVSVNENEAVARNEGTIVTRVPENESWKEDKNISLVSNMTANMDGIYKVGNESFKKYDLRAKTYRQ